MRSLANCVFDALNGRHARFAERAGRALRYANAVAPFAALPDEPSEQDWSDFATLLHRTGGGALHRESGALHDRWADAHDLDVHRMTVLQFSGEGLRVDGRDTGDIRELTADDVPAMRKLTELTKPGPFGERTIELGGYLGIWRDGVLAAMAGRRMSVPGWTEVSAVCTDPAFRGQGLASRLIRAVATAIRAEGDEVFLHVIATNTGAIELYERMGFTRSSSVEVARLTPRR
jgi:ribosomal protein S18 acetylase RimI-like enzyme